MWVSFTHLLFTFHHSSFVLLTSCFHFTIVHLNKLNYINDKKCIKFKLKHCFLYFYFYKVEKKLLKLEQTLPVAAFCTFRILLLTNHSHHTVRILLISNWQISEAGRFPSLVTCTSLTLRESRKSDIVCLLSLQCVRSTSLCWTWCPALAASCWFC